MHCSGAYGCTAKLVRTLQKASDRSVSWRVKSQAKSLPCFLANNVRPLWRLAAQVNSAGADQQLETIAQDLARPEVSGPLLAAETPQLSVTTSISSGTPRSSIASCSRCPTPWLKSSTETYLHAARMNTASLASG